MTLQGGNINNMAKSNLSKKAYSEIKKLILQNVIKPGQFITEMEMQERLCIGRTPIRDAFRELERDQLVIIHARKGVEVVNISPKKIREIFEIRMMIEPEILYTNMEKLDRKWLMEKREFFSMSVDKDSKNLKEIIIESAVADDMFHKRITDLCENSYIDRLVNSVFDYLAMIRVITSHNIDRLNASTKEHVKIIDCVLNEEREEAKEKLYNHIKTSLDETLLDLIKSEY